MTVDLVAFLRARYDEEERDAQIISCGGFAPEVWRAEPVRSGRWMQIVAYERETNEPPGSEYRSEDSPSVLVANDRAEWAHIVRWDPKRVVAEVDAKRRILAECGWAVKNGGGSAFVLPVLRLLALPYRDHPDYQPEWAPDGE